MRGISLLPKEYKKKQQALAKQARALKILLFAGAVFFAVFAVSNIWLIAAKQDLARLERENTQMEDESFSLKAYEDMSREVAAIKDKVEALEKQNPAWEHLIAEIGGAVSPGVRLENAVYKLEDGQKTCKLLFNGADHEDVAIIMANLEALEEVKDVYCSFTKVVTVEERDRIQFELLLNQGPAEEPDKEESSQEGGSSQED